MSTPSTVVDSAQVDEVVAEWPARPRLAVQQMLAQYGDPLEVSSEAIIWHNIGPYKRIMVTRMEIPHDFPKPHMDFLEHTVAYNVPTEKVEELIAYDASMTINKTAGEMSARCDLEGHNILTLNLARDIIQGTKSVEEARVAFGEYVVEDALGKHPAYVEKLQFTPEPGSAPFPDQPIIPGSPVRGTDRVDQQVGDAEILAFLIAMDDNVILSAMVAGKKELPDSVSDLAKRLHQAHGKNQGATMALGQKLGLTPVDTKAVDDLRVKGAGELATLVPLNGKDFSQAFVAAMAASHTEAIRMIDTVLLTAVEEEDLEEHLQEVRDHLVSHQDQISDV